MTYPALALTYRVKACRVCTPTGWECPPVALVVSDLIAWLRHTYTTLVAVLPYPGGLHQTPMRFQLAGMLRVVVLFTVGWELGVNNDHECTTCTCRRLCTCAAVEDELDVFVECFTAPPPPLALLAVTTHFVFDIV